MAWADAPAELGDFRSEIYRTHEMNRRLLDHYGFSQKPILGKEGATYTGEHLDIDKPRGRKLLHQSEEDQAAFMVKRGVHLLSNKVAVVNWSTVVEHTEYQGECANFFNYIGLIYNGDTCVNQPPDPGVEARKLSYFSLRFLIESLRRADWKSFTEVASYPLERAGFWARVYSFDTIDGVKKYLIWADYQHYPDGSTARQDLPLPVQVRVQLPALAGRGLTVQELIPSSAWGHLLQPNDYPSFFASRQDVCDPEGWLNISLSKTPLMISANN